jgi:CheY-like chemotaxis protein
MPGNDSRSQNVLFVDDDPAFLTGLTHLFTAKAGGSWNISTAVSHAQALERLGQGPIDLVVVDIGMPVMDGLQFLKLLRRTNPGQQTAVLTGLATPEHRKAAEDNGVALFLEKPLSVPGYDALFSALNTLLTSAPKAGFQGMMRQVGLQEVLQMECLNRKDSILEVFTAGARGRIYICEGSIVHAESGELVGEVALYGLLGLLGGEFNFLVYQEPPRRTISGHYEFLLMEAARLKDEGTTFFGSGDFQAAVEDLPALEDLPPATSEETGTRIVEILLCSGAGEVLFARDCSVEQRLSFLTSTEQQAEELGARLPAGRFDRLEILADEGRVVCVIQPHLRLLVRSRIDGGQR